MPRPNLSVIVASTLCLACAPALAAPIVDQSHLFPTSEAHPGIPVINQIGGSGYREAAQTFTVGISGRLTQIDLQIGGVSAYPITLDIRPVVSGTPDSDNSHVLGSFSLISPAWASIGQYEITSVDVSSALIDVLAGDVLAITLHTESSVFGGWGQAFLPNTYAAGGAFNRTTTTGSWNPENQDLGFRTFVDTAVSAVPEPTSVALLLSGLAGLAFRRHRSP